MLGLTYCGQDKQASVWGRHFQIHFHGPFNEYCCLLIQNSVQFLSVGSIDKNAALLPIKAWQRLGAKSLSKPMMAYLTTHICVTWLPCFKRWGLKETVCNIVLHDYKIDMDVCYWYFGLVSLTAEFHSKQRLICNLSDLLLSTFEKYTENIN